MNAYVSGVLLFLRERQGERENFQNSPTRVYETNKNKPSSFKRTNSKASSSRQFPIRTAELEYVLLLNVAVVSVVVVVVIFVWCVCSAIAPSDVQVFAGVGLTFRFEAKLRKI